MKEFSISLGQAKGKRILDKVEGFTTVVGIESHIIGTIGGKGNCIVHGRVEGDCNIEGALVIGNGGHWVGNIVAGCVLIAGTVDGDVTAKEKMEIVSTARVNGKITSNVLAIAEGAIHEGEMKIAGTSEVKRFKDRRSQES